MDHIYQGGCPDPLDPDARDANCPACVFEVEMGKVEAERDRLREMGDEMAAAVQERWTGPGGCDCRVCQAAEAWIAAGKVKQA